MAGWGHPTRRGGEQRFAMADSGRRTRELLDQLGRLAQHSRGNRQTQNASRPQIENDVELGGLFNGEVASPRPLRDLVHICRGASKVRDDIGAISHEPARGGPLAIVINGRNSERRGAVNDLFLSLWIRE